LSAPHPTRESGGAGHGRLTGAILFVVACAIRFAYVFHVGDEPAVRYPVLDAFAYHEWALAILDGHWLGDQVYYQDPLYPFFLAGLYWIFGPESLGVLLAQATLDATSVVLLYATARRLFDAPTALLAGALASTYAVYLYYAALLLKAPLLLFLFTLSLLLLVRAAQRGRLRDWGLWGLVFGLAALTRGNALLFLPALAAWAALDRERLVAKRLATFVAGTAGVLAVLIPVAVRNYAVGGDLVVLNSQGGQNFYIGNFRGNDTGAYRAPSFLRACPQHEEKDFEREAVAALGRPLRPSEISRYWLGRGLEEIAADPAHFARHLLRKGMVLANDYEVPDNYSFGFFAEEVVPALAWPLPRWGLLLPLAICGAFIARSRRETQLLLLFGIAYAAGLFVFFNLSRLRLPLVPLVLLFGAHGTVEILRRARARDWRPVLAALAFLALAYPAVYATVGGERHVIRFFNLAQAHQARGRAHRDRAAELSAAGDERAARAELAISDGERDLAEQAYRDGLAQDSHSRRLRNGLRMLLEVRLAQLERLGRDREALEKARALTAVVPDFADGHARKGVVLARLGERDAARQAFRQALSIDPTNKRARNGLLKLEFGRGRDELPRPDGGTSPEPGA
jgi:4-amino-4-deoxy-L-arabinose transferase-like glycosyltransferase